MLRDSASQLRIKKDDEPSDKIVCMGYLACPGLASNDDIKITHYSRNPWTVYINASPEDSSTNLGDFCLSEHELEEGSGSRHFLLSRAKNRKPGIIITASGYEFTGYVQVHPWKDDFPGVKIGDRERISMDIVRNQVDMFHIPGGVKKAFAMHKKRLDCLEIGALSISEAHEIYKAIADVMPRY